MEVSEKTREECVKKKKKTREQKEKKKDPEGKTVKEMKKSA